MITITKEQLESHVPALANAEGDVYSLIKGVLDEVSADVELFAEGRELTTAAVAFICNEAARRALPHLDLVITSSGIGVVSNQNVAPASRERVEALRASLHRTASACYDLFVSQLARQPEWDTAHAKVSHLLFTSYALRQYGVKYAGEDIYLDQFLMMRGDLLAAAESVAGVCGRDFYTELIDAERGISSSISATVILPTAEMLTMCLLRGDKRRAEHYRMKFIDHLRRYEPESYVGTREQEANDFESYQNEQEHPTFFSV